MHNIVIDSRKIQDGDTFICLEKDFRKAKSYILDALNKGAKKAYSSHEIDDITNSIKSNNILETLKSELHQVYFAKPTNIIMITGTNGKTSTAYFIQQILTLLGKKCLYIGTLGVYCNDQNLDNTVFNQYCVDNLTTPDVATLHKILHIAKIQGECDYAVVEASSHGIDQGRIDFLEIKVAGFTNFTQDHLDYHGTMEHYRDAKGLLFSKFLSNKGTAVINLDSSEAEYFINQSQGKNIITYGLNENATFRMINLQAHSNDQLFNLHHNLHEYGCKTLVPGKFQIYNLTCSIAMLYSIGLDILDIINIIPSITPPKGRMQRIHNGDNYTNIIVDYAHTPDALNTVLKELKKICQGRLFVLFGCGGNRDKEKRGEMGKIAIQNADYVIITDDNPRNENPSQIRQDIIRGIQEYKQNCLQQNNNSITQLSNHSNFIEIISNREEAIEFAIRELGGNDLLLIAGRGHENFQTIAEKKHKLSDGEVVFNYLIRLKNY